MKYRRLQLEELKSLEQEFVRFLASNHITKEDWEQLKKTEMEKVESLLEIFSDIVWEKTLKDIQYLEFTTSHTFKAFSCQADSIELIGLTVADGVAIDLTKYNLLLDLPELIQQHPDSLQLFTIDKPYQKSREMELFQLMEGGCLISKTGHMYQLLKALKA